MIKKNYLFIFLVIIFFAALVTAPEYDFKKINSGIFFYAPENPEELDLWLAGVQTSNTMFYKEGLYGSVLVSQEPSTANFPHPSGRLIPIPYSQTFSGDLKTMSLNGRIQCGTDRIDMITNTLLATAPIIFHKDPKTALNIGLGCGITLSVLEDYPFEKITQIEIDPVVIEAAQNFNDANNNALKDPRLELIVADARNHLKVSDEKFDIIVNEPFDPWVSTSTYLYSLEAFQTMRDHLNEGGIVSQWVPIFELTEEDFKSFYKTFNSVFPYTVAFVSKTKQPSQIAIGEDTAAIVEWREAATEIILLGSTKPFTLNQDLLNQRLAVMNKALEKVEIKDIREFYLFSGDELQDFAGDVPLYTDDNSLIEFSAARALYERPAAEVLGAINDYIAKRK